MSVFQKIQISVKEHGSLAAGLLNLRMRAEPCF